MKDISAPHGKAAEVLIMSKCGRGSRLKDSLDRRDNLNGFAIQISSAV